MTRALLFLFSCLSSFAAPAWAQDSGASSQILVAGSIDPAAAAMLLVSEPLRAEQQGPSALSLTRTEASLTEAASVVRRARWRIGVGSLMAATAGAAFMSIANDHCGVYGSYNKSGPLVVAGLFATAGLGLTARGAVDLALISRETRSRVRGSTGRRIGLGFAAIGASLLSTVVIGTATLAAQLDHYGCLNS